MRITRINTAMHCAVAATILLVATHASAFHLYSHRHSQQAVRSITLSYTPATSLLYFGSDLAPLPVATSSFDVPELMTLLLSIRSGGGDDHHGHGGGDDSSHGGGHDSSDGDHGGGHDSTSSGDHGSGHDSTSSSDHDGGHDSTASGDHSSDSTNHDGNNDSTNHGSGRDSSGHSGDNDSTGHDGGHDSTGHDGGHDSTNHDGGKDSTDHDGGRDTTALGGHDGDDSTHTADDSTHTHADTLDTGDHDGHHGGDHDSVEVHDSTDRTLFGASQQSILIRSHGGVAVVDLQFTNDLAQAIDVTGISLANGTNFAIVGDLPTPANPLSLASGGKLPIRIAFDAADVALHADHLNIATNARSATVSLQGIRMLASAVSTTDASGVTIAIAPNPASKTISADITGLSNIRIRVFTANGDEVTSEQLQNSHWSWNIGAALAAGEYVVRIDGLTTDGKAYSTTRNLIVTR